MKRLSKNAWILRALWAFLVFTFVVANYWIDPETIRVLTKATDLDHGVKAAIFALAAAGLLFIPLIPKSAEEPNAAKVVDWFIRALGALTAFFTGWHWLLAETQSKPGPYIMAVLMVAVLLATVLIIQFGFIMLGYYWNSLVNWCSRLRNRRK